MVNHLFLKWQKKNEIIGDSLRKFAAAYRIKELERGDSPQASQEIKELGLEHQIVTRQTSLIMVDDQNSEVVGSTMVMEKVSTKFESEPEQMLERSRSSGRGRGGAVKSRKMFMAKEKDDKKGAKKKKESKDSSNIMPEMQYEEKKKSKSIVSSLRKKSNDSGNKTEERLRSQVLDRMKEKEYDSPTIGGSISNESGESGIIGLQKADGSWILDEVVPLLKLDKGVIESRNPCNNILLWITAITVCYLEKNYASTKDLWQLVAKKATIFIKKQCKALTVEYDTLIQAANQILI